MRKLLFDKKVVENAEEYFQAIKAGYQPVFLSWKESDRTDELYGYVCAKRGEDDDAAFLYLSMDIGDWELYGWDAEEDKTVDDWDLLQSILDKENPLVWGILGGYLIKHLGDKDLVLEGIAYLQKAVECGNVYAACRLASFYMYHDEWKDVQKAEYYANYALEHGDFGAICVLK